MCENHRGMIYIIYIFPILLTKIVAVYVICILCALIARVYYNIIIYYHLCHKLRITYIDTVDSNWPAVHTDITVNFCNITDDVVLLFV